MTKKNYTAPEVEVMECKVERGFEMSSAGKSSNTEGVDYGEDQGALFN